MQELMVNLKDIYDELNAGTIPHVYKTGELQVA